MELEGLAGVWQSTIEKGQQGCGVSVEIQNVREGKDRHRVQLSESRGEILLFPVFPFSGFFTPLLRYATRL